MPCYRNLSVDTVTLAGKKILFTHGHGFSVKLGMERLYEAAKLNAADLVLYGHTHEAKTEYIDGIHYVNPGSVCSGRCGFTSYAIVDLAESGIVPRIIKT